MQIDLLINEAKYKDALPLYMFYSTGESDINEQMKNNPWLSEETFRWCEDCENGCYISLASAVYELLFGGSRRKILDGDPVIPLTVTYPPRMIAVGIEHAVAGAKKQPKTTEKRVIIPSEIVDKSNAKQFYFPDSAY